MQFIPNFSTGKLYHKKPTFFLLFKKKKKILHSIADNEIRHRVTKLAEENNKNNNSIQHRIKPPIPSRLSNHKSFIPNQKPIQVCSKVITPNGSNQ